MLNLFRGDLAIHTRSTQISDAGKNYENDK